MRTAVRVVACALLVLAATVPAAGQQTAAADEPALRTEVNAFMDQYYELFSAGRIDELAARIYHPSGQFGNQGHSSIDQMKARFPDTRKAFLAKGYGRSQLLDRRICVVTPTVAIVNGRGMRYLASGEVMGEYGWTYTLIKGPAGWRMASVFTHDPKMKLTCAS